MYKLSVFMPCIRVHNLKKFYETLSLSCKRYSFQLVICGPFEPPEEFKKMPNFKFVQSYASPTVSAQLAAIACDGELIYHTTDDCLFIEDAIDECIDLFDKSDKNNIISMRYIESANHANKTSFPLRYWLAGSSLPLPNINPNFNINAHFLMTKELFLYFGGFDCQFEYLTHASADLLIRMQSLGSVVFHSPKDVTTADWFEGIQKDHEPIAKAQEGHDYPLFLQLWMARPDPFARRIIPLDNYKNQPEHWERRFGKEKPTAYDQLKLN
jgi:hypothetical protein